MFEFSEMGQNNAQKKNLQMKVFLFIIDIFGYFLMINIDIILLIIFIEFGIIFIFFNILLNNVSINLVTT